MVSPGAAASSPLPLNGNCVNPLKVHPPAAVTRQSRTGRWREGAEERRGKEKRQQQTVRRKSAVAQCCSHHAERAKQTVGLRLVFTEIYIPRQMMSRFLKSEAAMQFGEKKVRKAGRDRLPIYFR